MLRTIEINAPETTSRIIVGKAMSAPESFMPEGRTIIITDSNVHRRYREFIDGYEHIILGMGETQKTLQTVERIYRELITMEADRDCFIVGFGGGIITDITGFTAATYMRGVPFGFIASTLMAQADASVGGKNGINIDGYKNMAGTFRQPQFVVCDPTILKTLPEREFRAGLAEVIKAGIIARPELFAELETTDPTALQNDSTALQEIIYSAVSLKADIVGRDVADHGVRRLLNLGHTFGHAIEKETSQFNHGEAVAAGICLSTEFASVKGVLKAVDAERIVSLIRSAGLPVEPPVDRKRLAKAILHDKKRHCEKVDLVLPTAIGRCTIEKIPVRELEDFFSQAH